MIFSTIFPNYFQVNLALSSVIMFIYGSQSSTKSFRFPLAMYVSLSSPIQPESSLIHILNVGASILFQHSATALLAWRSPKSRTVYCFDVCRKFFGYIPSTHSLAFRGTLALNISDKQFITSFQKFCIFTHSHKQWNNVPFSFKHFVQSSGMLAFIWWSLTGVMYTLINHLYWSSRDLVFIVCFWAFKHASFQSNSSISSFISIFQAFNLSIADSILCATSIL